MIITRIMGGLGNQMAQYAFGEILSRQLKTKLMVDIEWFNSQTGDTIRKYCLNYFRPNLKNMHNLNRMLFFESCNFPFSYIFRNCIIKDAPGLIIDINKLNPNNNYYLDGYWFKLDYFDKHKKLVNDLFQFHEPSPEVANWMNLIGQKDPSVSIHIRRGDYVTNLKAKAIFGVLPLEYYLSSIKYFESKYKHPNFFVFSNDLDWAKDNLLHQKNIYYVKHNDEDIEDLRLMTKCQHHIIANSTFSWWGAWLNETKDNVIIAPKKWYQADLSTNNFVPESWIRL